MSTRRDFLTKIGASAVAVRFAGVGAALTGSVAAHAQSTGPITLVVGFPAGGGPDLVARALAEAGQRELNQPIVVQNKTGAGGRIALDWLGNQATDGSAFGLTPAAMLASFPHVYKKLSYDPNNFVPVCKICDYHVSVVTRSDSPFSTLKEFVAWAKETKRGTFGVPSRGSGTDFVGNLLSKAEDLALEPILYRGGPQLTQAVLAGEVDVAINLSSNFVELAKAGKVKVLAVSTATRSPFSPDVPTLAELGYGDLIFEESIGIVARKGTPENAILRMQEAVQKAMGEASVLNALRILEYRPDFKQAKQYGEDLAAASERYKAFVQKTNFQPLD
ncbi:Bug family tripartite tricarboxylate transporter substrate binding protein [Achromobacter aegrifaciens]